MMSLLAYFQHSVLFYYADVVGSAQGEFQKAKPARDAAARAEVEKLAAEAELASAVELHEENEWNIRYLFHLKNWSLKLKDHPSVDQPLLLSVVELDLVN